MDIIIENTTAVNHKVEMEMYFYGMNLSSLRLAAVS